MTVSTTSNRVIYRGNGAATNFAVPFKVLDEDHLVVRRRIFATGVFEHTYIGTDYSYAGIGASSGTLTLSGAALASTYELVIERIVPYTQDLDIVNAGGFYPDTVEEQLDLIVMGMQQLDDLTDRALLVPEGEAGLTLPIATARADKIAAFDSAGALEVLAFPTVTTASGEAVNSLAALEAIVGPVNDQAVFLTDAAVAGMFVFDSSDLSAAVTADPQQSTYVAPSSDATGASGAWVRTGLIDARADLTSVSTSILPLGDIVLPSEFNNTLNAETYWDGAAVQYKVSPYDLIDFTLSETVNNYYVNFATGLDTNAGTSSALAWKTLTYAIANAVSPAVIHVEDDIIGVGNLSSAIPTFSGKLKIIGEGSTGRSLRVGRRETENLASFAWAASGGAGAYVSVAAAARYYRAQFDGKFRNVKGFPRPITDAGSIAACQTTPGTFFWDVALSDLYVHMWDNRVPDPDDGWIYCESPYRLEVQQVLDTAAGVILFENLEIAANLGTSTTGICRYRPVTTGSPNTARFGTKNCLVYGSSGNGFEIYDADVAVLEDCHAAFCRRDGLNYHSFVTTNPDGEYITVYEHNCSAKECGFTGWADQTALSASSNASTMHDAIHILRSGTRGFDCNGAVIADVNGGVSVNLNVLPGQPVGTANPMALFWHSGVGVGANRGMWLWGCGGHDRDDSNIIVLTNSGTPNAEADGQIYVKDWLGNTNVTVVGILKDWNGGNL